MSQRKIIIIGLGSAGFAAALAAKKTDPKAALTIIEKRGFDMFSPCGLPFAIEGRLSFDSLLHRFPAEDMGITKLLNHEVTSIDTKSKTVSVVEKSGEAKILPFDSLVIATGAAPLMPFEKINGVFTVHDIDTAKAVSEFAVNARNAVVVGAGPIGLELAWALYKRGLSVLVVELLPSVLPKALDPDMAKQVESMLGRHMKIITGKPLDWIGGTDSVESVRIAGTEYPADMVIVASGVRAGKELAGNAGIEVGRWGIRTNVRMETNVKDVFAAGDCTETVSPISHMPWVSQLSNTAFSQGTAAGTNAAGGYDTFDGSVSTFVTVVGGMEVAATGFNTNFAESYGFNTVSGKAKGRSKPDWFPGSEELTVKLIADAKTTRLIGAQAVGSGAAARVNVAALAIKNRLSLHELAHAELAYCPAVAESHDALTRAAEFALRRIKD
ncbi:MAG TPA: FAD-dependent oxidoreductase [Candidatus Methanoperedenaceae archaeon]|nr:FAD-dependent oxidoreductase [Candidatus Methanoperedenaceae archaeon]